MTHTICKLMPSDNLNSVVCCDDWKNQMKYVLFDEEIIERRLCELAEQLNEKYKNKTVLCVGLLNGCIMFTTNLLAKVNFRYKLDFINVSSYGHETISSGSVKLKKDISIDPNGYDVLILEDLIDTGITLEWIKKHLESKNCKNVEICCLLNKIERRSVNVTVDYVGFECPNEFVVGYGMDYHDEFRCLPFVGVIDTDKI